MTRNCKHCRFCELSEANSGLCRRYAPRPRRELQEDGDIPAAEWPRVYSGDWCGEFVEYVPVPAPPVAADEREQAGATAEPSSPASAGEGHVGGAPASGPFG